eukprot:6752500-Pyramimonas_sp.AAC.1
MAPPSAIAAEGIFSSLGLLRSTAPSAAQADPRIRTAGAARPLRAAARAPFARPTTPARPRPDAARGRPAKVALRR